MEMIFSGIAQGMAQLLDPVVLALIAAGTIFGIVIGALPGLTSTMGVALIVPITFGMTPVQGLSLLGAIYCSSTYAGAISAILINIPGTPANCCTVLDGFPMTKKGQAGLAIALATVASAIGGIISNVALLFLAPPLADLALRFGAQEYFLLALFGVSVIASLSERNMLKGFISGTLGLFLSIVGMHPLTGDIRFTLGIPELFNGLPLVVALIGLYSIPEVIANLSEVGSDEGMSFVEVKGVWRQMLEVFKYKMVLLRSTIIGIIVGIVPGAGSSIAGFIAYDDTKKKSKNPETFGTGNPAGVVASETANNAVVGGSLIPSLTLGIPGNAVSAVLIGGLMIHGLKPGPALFTENSGTIYGFILSMFISNIVFIPVGLLIARYGIKIIKTPPSILGPLVIGLAVIGAYALNMSLVDVWIMLAIGLMGFAMKEFDVPREPLVLGLVLGSMAEGELARSMALVQGSVPALLLSMVTRPISLIIILLTALSIFKGLHSQLKPKKSA
ncbi:MAG TPA: tripartite tricarboxylate transporter permease [Rectinema sp.]|jgi:putative tricarboxylic transport membrane protein|nr:tripartite tricarboxylate transporter permease [Rectinema sp.]HOU61562.1 tripartite tricarboxylate transporter permease [Rectinema sp.]HQG15412.1 tripartite tricarboxylate transporter permease [Rectinema sp.]HQH88375.1 tripartite tricarboxylate transporter permease [Rectinema sp.]HQJ22902.1 tripartite tricarboxylate transporter permease [Rectinema sp.]